MTTTTNRNEAINAIIQYFKENEDTFNEAIEELDAYNGYLNDDRYYSMEELDEFYGGESATEILQRAFFGYDEDYTDKDGNHPEAFNPNKPYFRYNGYGNLVSAYYKDYSAYIGAYAIEAMEEHRNDIYAIDNDLDLMELFNALEEADGEA